MAQIISVSIDLNKIDKSRIVTGKNGAKYYNMIINVNDKKDNYNNDVSIVESQTKEEREAKATKKYIGNGRIIWQSHYEQQPEPSNPKQAQNASVPSDDLPF